MHESSKNLAIQYRTVQVRLETNTLRLPGGTSIFVVSRQ
jgi:hypothetical protein